MTTGAAVRIVSLVPSVTETLLSWGVRPVGVTRFCEQPGLRAVGGTKDPDLDAICALAPELVVCCTEENRLEDAEAMAQRGIEVLALEIDGVEDVGPALAQLAEVVGIEVDDVTAALPAAPAGAPAFTAVVPIWRRPWMVLGPRCYGTSLLARLGVGVVAPVSSARYPTVGWDELERLAPDRVLAPSEPYPFGERHVAELERLAPVVLVDGRDLFWWGTRTPGAYRRLAATLGTASP